MVGPVEPDLFVLDASAPVCPNPGPDRLAARAAEGIAAEERRSRATPAGIATAVALLLAPVIPGALAVAEPGAPGPSALRVTVDGAIGAWTGEVVERAIARAEAAGAACLVIALDTPGGLDVAMRRIVKRILGAQVPVVVYVSPSGARAASAGTFIAMAAHVAAMAPGTNLGAAHPVQLGGGIADTVMSAKATNDAAAYIRTLAEKRGRNAAWAERAVVASASITEREALAQGVIDVVAASAAALMDSIDGRRVELPDGPRTLATRGVALEDLRGGWRESALSALSDPNVAYVLMLIGIYGLLFELSNPGAIFPGVAGGLCLILAFYAFHTLPLNYAGAALILLAIVLFALELKVPSHGALTIGGIAAMAAGSAMLVDVPDGALRVSWFVIAPAVATTALFFAFAVGMGLRAQRRKRVGGVDDLVGMTGVARDAFREDGFVVVAGEYWQASSDEPVAAGAPVEIIAVDGSRVRVRPV